VLLVCGDGKESFRNANSLKKISKEDEISKPIPADVILEMKQKKYDRNYMAFIRDNMR